MKSLWPHITESTKNFADLKMGEWAMIFRNLQFLLPTQLSSFTNIYHIPWIKLHFTFIKISFMPNSDNSDSLKRYISSRFCFSRVRNMSADLKRRNDEPTHIQLFQISHVKHFACLSCLHLLSGCRTSLFQGLNLLFSKELHLPFSRELHLPSKGVTT